MPMPSWTPCLPRLNLWWPTAAFVTLPPVLSVDAAPASRRDCTDCHRHEGFACACDNVSAGAASPLAPSLPADRAGWWLATRDVVAGTAGGVAGIAAGQPLDTIRVRIQSGEFNSMRQCIVQTAKNEGMRAFFKGMTSPIVGNLPINTIVFGARGHMDRLLSTYLPRDPAEAASGRPSYWRVMAAAAWAGTLQLVVVIPVENVKVKLQVQQTPIAPAGWVAAAAGAADSSAAACASVAGVSTAAIPAVSSPLVGPSASKPVVYSGSFDCVRQLYRLEGLRGVYAGGVVTAWRDVPAYAAWFLAYDFTRVALTTPEELASDAPVHTRVALLAGSAAGIATWVSTYPFDVIKSVIQAAPPSTPKRELRIMHVARVNYAKHGFKWFWLGIGPTLLRAVPVSAVTFYVYERCLDMFGR